MILLVDSSVVAAEGSLTDVLVEALATARGKHQLACSRCAQMKWIRLPPPCALSVPEKVNIFVEFETADLDLHRLRHRVAEIADFVSLAAEQGYLHVQVESCTKSHDQEASELWQVPQAQGFFRMLVSGAGWYGLVAHVLKVCRKPLMFCDDDWIPMIIAHSCTGVLDVSSVQEHLAQSFEAFNVHVTPLRLVT
jgi:hypothetical protein